MLMYLPGCYHNKGLEFTRSLPLKYNEMDEYGNGVPDQSLLQETNDISSVFLPKDKGLMARNQQMNVSQLSSFNKPERAADAYCIEIPDDGMMLKGINVTISFWVNVTEDPKST